MRNPPTFNDYERGPDFDRARTQIATPFQYLDIALDTALVDQQYTISGDFLYIDTAFDGEATIELNNQQNAPVAPFYVQAGFALNALFKSLKVSADAQPGKKIRIMYSTGERVIPALSGTLAITGTVNTLSEPYTYGACHKSTANMAANTPETVFTAAANASGAVINRATFMASSTGAAGAPLKGFLVKATAPASITDGDLICVGKYSDSPSNVAVGGSTDAPIFIPAGFGLYYISTNAEIAGYSIRQVLYTLN